MNKVGAIAAVLSTVVMLGSAQSQEWVLEALIRIPYSNSLFLARDAQDNVYGTTFNSLPRAGEVVAFKISNAMEARPEVAPFDRFLCPSDRGYSGITVAKDGSIFLAADQGDGLPSFIKKYKPGLELDTSFGTNGVLASSKIRILGLTSLYNYVIAGVSWARFLVIDSSGRYLGMTPELPRNQQALIRDIDIIPSTREIVGVDRDSVYIFTGGRLDNLAGYTLRTLVRGHGRPVAGAGICYSPSDDHIYFTVNAARKLGSVTRTTRRLRLVESVTAHLGTVQPCDAVISADGSTMFVSDLQSANVARYRRGGVSVQVGWPRQPGTVLAALPGASGPGAVAPARAVTDVSAESKVQAMETAASNAAPEAAISTSTPEIAPAPPSPAGPTPQIPALEPPAIAMLPSTPIPGTPAPSSPITPASVTPALTATPGALNGLPSLPELVARDATPLGSTAPAAGTGSAWEASPEAAFGRAAGTNKKVAIFFYTPESTKAQEVERTVFGDPAFFSRYSDVVWSRVDASRQPDVLRQYGLFKVPAVTVFSSDRKELKRIEGLFTKEDFATWFPPGT